MATTRHWNNEDIRHTAKYTNTKLITGRDGVMTLARYVTDLESQVLVLASKANSFICM